MGDYSAPTIQNVITIDSAGRSRCVYLYRAGGQGLLLRYFCVFFYRVPGDLPSFQQNTLKNEAETAINNAQGCIESTEFKGNYAVMLLLLPLKTELQPLFAGIIDECNQYGNFLHENMIITNVKKLTDEEIMHLLHAKNKPE